MGWNTALKFPSSLFVSSIKSLFKYRQSRYCVVVTSDDKTVPDCPQALANSILITVFDQGKIFTVSLSFRPKGEIMGVPATLMVFKIPPSVGMT